MKKIIYPLILLLFVLGSSCTKDGGKNEDVPVISPYKLYINEIRTTDIPDWIEIFNPTLADIDLSGGKVMQADQRTFVLPDGCIIPAHGWHVVYFDDTTQAAAFSLSPSSGYLLLKDALGRMVDSISYPGLPNGLSYGRGPDGSPSWTVNHFPSPGLSNAPTIDRPPVIYDFWITNSEPLPIETISISTISEDDQQQPHVALHYSYPGFDSVIELFQVTCGNGYSCIIPPLPSGTIVRYYLVSEDNMAQQTFLPANAPAYQLRYTVK